MYGPSKMKAKKFDDGNLQVKDKMIQKYNTQSNQ